MSLGRRSDRVRKKVDYAKFCEDEDRSADNSDDDFQDDGIPAPLKKIKSTVTVKSKAKQKQKEAQSISKQSGAVKRKERLSRDERFYQKELEAALKASIRESQQSSADNESSSTANNDEEDISDDEDKVESKRKKARLLPSSDLEDNNKENTGGEPQINLTRRSASDGEAGSSDDRKHKQVAKISNLKENDSLEEVEDEEERDEPELDQEESDLDSEEMSNAGSLTDDGDDSDFDEAEAKKKIKGRGRGKSNSSPTKPGVKPRTSVTVTPLKMLRGKGKSKGRAPSANSSHSVSSSASNSPTAAANEPALLQAKAVNAISDSLPKTYPGMGLGGVNIKSSGPPIRLGLSRNVRVKPLHSHVSVQH